MIAYLDTSAIVPLLVEEPGSHACRQVWNDADDVVTSRLSYVEAAAALAQAKRLGRVTLRAQRGALTALGRLWSQLQVVNVDQVLVERAAVVADSHGLRGYDAVHCAGAELINDDTVVAVSGDRRLLAAWQAFGLATYDIVTSG